MLITVMLLLLITISMMMMAIRSETTPACHGLLTGFNKHIPGDNITSFHEMYYTDKLNFIECKEKFYKDYDILWKMFMQDIITGENPDHVIECISKAAKKFVKSNDIYDRGEIIQELKSVEIGDLVVLSGGPSIGKSLVLNHLFGKRQNYLYLDGRETGPDIISAIVKNLMKRDKLRLLTVESIAPLLISPLSALIGNDYDKSFLLSEILNKIVKVVSKSPQKNVASLEFILELMTNLQSPIEGIIFDEANKYFIKNSLPLLDVLTFLTKQKRQLAVIMATSDYGFPFALENIGYNTFHISKSLVLSDISPYDTLRLLSSWGVRPNLAYLLVEIYGGHVLQISRALIDLHIKKENAKINTYFISGLKNRLAVCIKESKDAGICEKVITALDTLMSLGFFACNFNDPVAELLTKCNIAGFIGSESIVPGLSTTLRRTETGLVPSVQMIRIVYSLMTYKKHIKRKQKRDIY